MNKWIESWTENGTFRVSGIYLAYDPNGLDDEDLRDPIDFIRFFGFQMHGPWMPEVVE
tara:strand:+ start:17 stop:190 length:174 start_codon:yes stop_codon:yes gene_type:complete